MGILIGGKMIWSDLDLDKQQSIILRYSTGESVSSIAKDYELNPESLGRKMRLIKPAKTKLFDSKQLHLKVKESTKVFVYSDTHFGVEDESALEAALLVAEWYKPDMIFNLGDTLNCYNVSKYKKDLVSSGLQEERDRWAEWAERLNTVCPKAQKYILIGNHEERFTAYLADAKGIADLEELSLDDLLYTKQLGYHPLVNAIYVNPRGDDLYPDAQLYVLHGEKALSQAGSSTKAASDMYAGASTMVGHAHRSAVYTRRTGRGMVVGYEVGTLASLQPDYDAFPNWSQSVMTGIISSSYHAFNLHLIDRGKVMIDGKLHSV